MNFSFLLLFSQECNGGRRCSDSDGVMQWGRIF